MSTMAEFESLRPVVVDASAHQISDVLMSDLGLHDAWEMRARESFLEFVGDDRIHDLPVALHPQAAVALHNAINLTAFSLDVDRAERHRMRRLCDKVSAAIIEHAQHPWFLGRRKMGSSNVSIPAWCDGWVLFPYWSASARPVVLRPIVSKGPQGMNVTWFEIEEVEG